ncbi:MAG: hypothetical protein WAV95_02235 [Azonexus sp.]
MAVWAARRETARLAQAAGGQYFPVWRRAAGRHAKFALLAGIEIVIMRGIQNR